VHELPIVFLIENNQWAISNPAVDADEGRARQPTRQPATASRAPLCDGFDPIATYAAMHVAMERARSGGGPTLVEANCYRYLSHSTDDDDRTYRSRRDIEEQRKRDPVPRFEQRLIEAGASSTPRSHAACGGRPAGDERSNRRRRSATVPERRKLVHQRRRGGLPAMAGLEEARQRRPHRPRVRPS